MTALLQPPFTAPPDRDTGDLLRDLRAAGLSLSVSPENVLLAGPRRLLTDERATAIRASRDELRLWILGEMARAGEDGALGRFRVALAEYEMERSA